MLGEHIGKWVHRRYGTNHKKQAAANPCFSIRNLEIMGSLVRREVTNGRQKREEVRSRRMFT